MSQKPKDSWTERSGRELTDEQFLKIRMAAADLPDLLAGIYTHLDKIYEHRDNKPTAKLAQEFINLREVGGSQTHDDAFRKLEGMRKDDITQAKDEWFQKVALLYRRVANAVAGRPLEDVKPWKDEDTQHVPEKARELLVDVLRNMQYMEEVYPPSQSIRK